MTDKKSNNGNVNIFDSNNIIYQTTFINDNNNILQKESEETSKKYQYIAYFDNYTAYHFMAQYSIMPSSAAESPHIRKTFSTQADNVIFVSKTPILDNIIIKSDDSYQVAFEINLEKLPKHEKIYAVKDETIEEISIKYYKEPQNYDLIAINNIIPFEAIEFIFLKSEEDRDHFINGRLANIIFQHFEIQVKPEIFDGEELNLPEVVLNKISEIKTNSKYIRNVNHMRAALLSSLMSTSFPLTNSIVTAQDDKMLKILANNTSKNNEKQIMEEFKYKVNKKLVGEGYKPIQDIVGDDNTPLSECLWINKQINEIAKGEFIKPEFAIGLGENYENTVDLIDIYAFRVLCWLLINIKDFKPLTFIDQFKEEFNTNIKDLNISENSNLNYIVETYNLHFDKLKANLKGTGQPASKTKQQNYSTLIALNHFGMSYKPSDHFSSLYKYLESKNQINQYHKRLVWFLYGLCHGMHKVNNDFKIDLNNLALIDNLFFYQKDNITIHKSLHNEFIVENDGLHAIFTISMEHGDLSDLINELKENNKSMLEKILLGLEKFPEYYLLYRTICENTIEYSYKEFIDKKSKVSITLSKKKPDYEVKIYWEVFNTENFITQINNTDKKTLSRKLTSHIYGDSYGY